MICAVVQVVIWVEFQYSIGDALCIELGCIKVSKKVSILHWRCKACFVPGPWSENVVFQYSIGDAEHRRHGAASPRDVRVSILHWRCRDVGSWELADMIHVSILHWRCVALFAEEGFSQRMRGAVSILHWRCGVFLRLFAPLPVFEVGFNTPLEMPAIATASAAAADTSMVSILHWRCRFCAHTSAPRRHPAEGFNTPLEMQMKRGDGKS